MKTNQANRFFLINALMKKEFLQIIRDPSCILIAFVLPLILLLLFGFALSLDAKHERTAVVLEDRSPLAFSVWETLKATEYIDAIYYPSLEEARKAMINSQVHTILVIPCNFTRQMNNGKKSNVMLIADGGEAYTATITANYIQGIMNIWLQHQLRDNRIALFSPAKLIQRIWFNSELNTKYVLVPWCIVLIMAIIGSMLTALVVSREWERGTMEAMLATPVRKVDMVLSKLIPYYLIGMGAVFFCVVLSRFLFHVPFRGSIFPFFLASSVFLLIALLQGFFISTAVKNQFLASMAVLILGFLPNFFLSGVLFEIDSMPILLRGLTYLFPARYYVVCIQTSFIVGDVWYLFLRNIGMMSLMVLFFLIQTIRITPKRLE